LPDGLFSNKKIPIWVNFGGLGMEKNGIFYGDLEYITVFWYNCGPFGNLCSGKLVNFPHFGIVCQEKSGNPGFIITA
jgi:hypothetical protein